MENNQTKKTQLFKSKAYTFFIVPFFYDGIWDEIHEKISRWQPIQEDLYSEDILYPYIIELFKKEEGANKNAEKPLTNRLKIYQLSTKDEGSKSEFFFDRILGKRQVAIIEQENPGMNSHKAIPFRFLNDKNYAPHLFISPSAKIGMMTLCVELGDGCSVQDLQQFNYCLHKRNEIANVVIKREQLPNGKEKTTKDKRTMNYRIVCPSPETQKSLSDVEIMNTVTQYLSIDSYKQLIDEKQNINDASINWDLNFFTNFLLNTFRPDSPVKYFNKERMHVYTFCSLDDTISPDRELTTEDIIPIALRLSRVVNSKYLLNFDEMVRSGSLLQTYQNIYFSSAIEGTAMVCIAKDINKEFVGGLQNMFNRQYLLIYLLVLIQRYTLLSIDRKLTEYDAINDNTDKGLWDLINLIRKIKVNCYYTDVSVYTHHSQFYQHCCRNLHIPETFNEIDEKVELLKLTTDRQMQQLLEAQKKQQEEEARLRQQEIERIKAKEEEEAKLHQQEIERKKAKEEEDERKRKEEKEQEERIRELEKDEAERRQNILNIIVAILTVAQVVQAVYELYSPDPEKNIAVPLSTGIVCLALLIWIGKKDLMKLWNNNN